MLVKRLGIDLGTANSLVWLSGKGIVLQEPTVVAVSIEDNRVVAVGREAKRMLGRTPGNIIASRPMRDGVIADYLITEAMLRYFIQQACGRSFFFKPEVMICIPAGATQVERRAVIKATLSAGARRAYMIDEPLAAAIGAGVPIAEANGHMIVDIGGGAAEAAIISLGSVVVHESARVAGNKIDEAIIAYIKRKHNLQIGDLAAEQVKIRIGSALPLEKKEEMEIKGRDNLSGLPRTIKINSDEVTEAIQRPLYQIIQAVKAVLENVPPELSSDIIDRGITMSGGTSLLRNFNRLMTKETGVPAYVVEEPMLAVVKGTGVALENLDLYKRSIKMK